MDFPDDDQLDFQLKIHTLERYLISKQYQIDLCQNSLSTFASKIFNDQGKILQLISEVKNTTKNVQHIFHDIKKVFQEVNLTLIFDFFKNISSCLVQAIRLLASSCVTGLEQNLISFSKNNNDNNENKTVGTKISQQDIIKQLEANNRRGNQFYSDIRTKMEIDKIYQNVLLQKNAVERLSPSCASSYLFAVQKQLNFMAEQTDLIVEDAYLKRNRQARESQTNKIQKPEDLDRIFKAQMSDNIKQCFKVGMQRVSKKMQKNFYQNQYTKLKEEILKLKVKTNTRQIQTDTQPEAKGKNTKQKKIIDKLNQKIKDLENQNDDLIDKHLQQAKYNNQLIYQKQESGEQPLNQSRRRESFTLKYEERKSSKSRHTSIKKISNAPIGFLSLDNRQLNKENDPTSKFNLQFSSQKTREKARLKSKPIAQKTNFYEPKKSPSVSKGINSSRKITFSHQNDNILKVFKNKTVQEEKDRSKFSNEQIINMNRYYAQLKDDNSNNHQKIQKEILQIEQDEIGSGLSVLPAVINNIEKSDIFFDQYKQIISKIIKKISKQVHQNSDKCAQQSNSNKLLHSLLIKLLNQQFSKTQDEVINKPVISHFNKEGKYIKIVQQTNIGTRQNLKAQSTEVTNQKISNINQQSPNHAFNTVFNVFGKQAQAFISSGGVKQDKIKQNANGQRNQTQNFHYEQAHGFKSDEYKSLSQNIKKNKQPDSCGSRISNRTSQKSTFSEIFKMANRTSPSLFKSISKKQNSRFDKFTGDLTKSKINMKKFKCSQLITQSPPFYNENKQNLKLMEQRKIHQLKCDQSKQHLLKINCFNQSKNQENKSPKQSMEIIQACEEILNILDDKIVVQNLQNQAVSELKERISKVIVQVMKKENSSKIFAMTSRESKRGLFHHLQEKHYDPI